MPQLMMLINQANQNKKINDLKRADFFDRRAPDVQMSAKLPSTLKMELKETSDSAEKEEV